MKSSLVKPLACAFVEALSAPALAAPVQISSSDVTGKPDYSCYRDTATITIVFGVMVHALSINILGYENEKSGRYVTENIDGAYVTINGQTRYITARGFGPSSRYVDFINWQFDLIGSGLEGLVTDQITLFVFVSEKGKEEFYRSSFEAYSVGELVIGVVPEPQVLACSGHDGVGCDAPSTAY